MAASVRLWRFNVAPAQQLQQCHGGRSVSCRDHAQNISVLRMVNFLDMLQKHIWSRSGTVWIFCPSSTGSNQQMQKIRSRSSMVSPWKLHHHTRLSEYGGEYRSKHGQGFKFDFVISVITYEYVCDCILKPRGKECNNESTQMSTLLSKELTTQTSTPTSMRRALTLPLIWTFM